MRAPALTPHARRACLTRDLPADLVARIVADRVADLPEGLAVAVRVGRYRAERGALVGSNGDLVVAVVRGGVVATVMLRRSDQPWTAGALGVDVVAPRV